MSTFKQNDIVLITGATSNDQSDSSYINLFGKIKGINLDNVEVFIDIQGKTEEFINNLIEDLKTKGYTFEKNNNEYIIFNTKLQNKK